MVHQLAHQGKHRGGGHLCHAGGAGPFGPNPQRATASVLHPRKRPHDVRIHASDSAMRFAPLAASGSKKPFREREAASGIGMFMKIGPVPENLVECLLWAAGVMPTPLIDTFQAIIRARAIMAGSKL